MDTETDKGDVAFSKAFQDAQGHAPHAAGRLIHNPRNYVEDTVEAVPRSRRNITLRSPATNRNFVMSQLEFRPLKGWHLTTKGFFLTRSSLLLYVWADNFGTVITVRTFGTIYDLMEDHGKMREVALELKTLARH